MFIDKIFSSAKCDYMQNPPWRLRKVYMYACIYENMVNSMLHIIPTEATYSVF